MLRLSSLFLNISLTEAHPHWLLLTELPALSVSLGFVLPFFNKQDIIARQKLLGWQLHVCYFTRKDVHKFLKRHLILFCLSVSGNWTIGAIFHPDETSPKFVIITGLSGLCAKLVSDVFMTPYDVCFQYRFYNPQPKSKSLMTEVPGALSQTPSDKSQVSWGQNRLKAISKSKYSTTEKLKWLTWWSNFGSHLHICS